MAKRRIHELVLLRGGRFGEVLVEDVESDIAGLFIVDESINKTYIYSDTSHRTLREVPGGWQESVRVFEIDFRAMRENFQYEMIM